MYIEEIYYLILLYYIRLIYPKFIQPMSTQTLPGTSQAVPEVLYNMPEDWASNFPKTNDVIKPSDVIASIFFFFF